MYKSVLGRFGRVVAVVGLLGLLCGQTSLPGNGPVAYQGSAPGSGGGGGSGTVTSVGVGPGQTKTLGTQNTSTNAITTSGTFYSQLWPVAVSSSCTVNSNCNGSVTNETGEQLKVTGGSVTITLPNPSSDTKGNTYQIASDGTHGYTLTTAGGTAYLYGDLACGPVGSATTSCAENANVDVQVLDDGTNYKVTGAGEAAAGVSSVTGAGTVSCSPTTGAVTCTGSGGSGTVLYNQIGGCVESNDGTTPNSVLDIAACQASDSTNAVTITAAAFTKSTAGAWASGSGSNGMGNGLTIADSTWYHVCLANNGGTADYWFDTSVTCANKPSGISDTKYRRIGSFLTDGSAHILGFLQTNDTFTWKVQINNINSGSLPASVTTQAVAVPPGVKTIANLNFYTGAPSTFVASFIIVYDPDTSATNSNGNLNCSSSTTGAADAAGTCQLQITTNSSQQVDILPNAAVTGADLNTVGYRDFRGQ